MIADVDASLMAWLAGFLPGVGIVLAPPMAEPGASGAGDVSLLLFLGGIREELDAAEPGWSAVRDEHGMVTGRRAPTRSYRLSYLMVPFSSDPLAEHRVLGQILIGSALGGVLPEESLRGSLLEVEQPVLVRAAPPHQSVDLHDIWSAWGLRPRATLELSVLAQLPPFALAAVAGAPGHVEMGVARLPGVPQPEPDKPARPRPTHRLSE
jgi:hypothetical protein